MRSVGRTWDHAPEGSLTNGESSRGRACGVRVITIYAGDRATLVTNRRCVYFQNARLQEFGRSELPAIPFFFLAWRIWRRARVRMPAFSIVLDDFGTGYSSVGYLEQLGFDTMRIDRSFVSRLAIQLMEVPSSMA